MMVTLLSATVQLATSAAPRVPPPPTDDTIAQVFLDIAVIVIAARLMAALFRRLNQPAVIGELLAGLLLGPSALGQLPGNPTVKLFPFAATNNVRPLLYVIAQLGLIIFMFIVGLELDTSLIRGKARVVGSVAVGSMGLPFILAIPLGIFLYHRHPTGGHMWPFVLFVGTCVSATAFPVLARLLGERGMFRTEIGTLSLGAAAANDALSWTALAVVLALAHTPGGGSSSPGPELGETLGFLVVSFVVVRPLLTRLVAARRQAGRLTPNILAVVLIGLLLSAYATDRIGIHAIIGAFVFGAIMPREDSRELFADIVDRLEQVSVLLLLPVFFMITGLSTNVWAIGGTGAIELVLVLLVAIFGKLVGAGAGARIAGMRSQRATAVGVLMNSRGLTEIIILSAGMTAGLLDEQQFTVFVLMAVITSVMTGPLLRAVYSERTLARDVADAERAALGITDAYRIVALVNDPAAAGAITDTAALLAASESPAEVVLSRFTLRDGRNELGTGLLGDLAAVTESLGQLNALAAGVGDRGIACSVRSQFVDDVDNAVAGQVEAVDADLLLTAFEPAAVGTPPHQPAPPLACQVAAVTGLEYGGIRGDGSLPTGPVIVVPGPGHDGTAAVEVALRLAVADGRTLILADRGDRRENRSFGHVSDRLAATGLRIERARMRDERLTDSPGAVVVIGSGDPLPDFAPDQLAHDNAATTLLVRARAQDDGSGLDRYVEHLRERGGVTGEPIAVSAPAGPADDAVHI